MSRTLPPPPGYDRPDARAVAWLAAQLDDQSRLLTQRLAGAGRELLEWQPRPGINTIGMLLAHLAVAEAYWIGAVLSGGPKERQEANRIVSEIAGIALDDDPLPIAPGGGHPALLAGYPLDRYLALLERTRAHTHRCLQGWSDARLDEVVHSAGRPSTRAWAGYHLLEHFAQHAGQVALLQTLYRG
jgi:uncharacterized damage-inducible protein DinB